MNQLFYNMAGGVVHQIRREKRTTISEVIVRGKRNIKWSEANRDGADAESPFPLFFSFSASTLAQGKRLENCLCFGTGGLSLCLYPLLLQNILFFPALTMAAHMKKKFLEKWFAHTIRVHYRDFEHAYVYWIWLHGSASYVIILNITDIKRLLVG